MKNMLRIRSWALVSGLTAILCAGSGAALARDVVWSVGVGAPGVQVGLSNTPPVVVHRPVVLQAQPVYWQQPALHVQPQPIYYAQPPAVYYGQPRVIVVPQHHHRGWGPRHHGRHDRWGRDRHGFGDDRGDHGRR